MRRRVRNCLSIAMAFVLVCLLGTDLGKVSAANQSAESEASQDEVQKPGTQDPPWLSNGQTAKLPSVTQLEPADAFVNLDPSEIDALLDGAALTANNETLLKVLYRIPVLSLADVHRFVIRNQNVSVDDIQEDPDAHRFQMFHLKGAVTKVETVPLIEQLAERFEFDRYYKVTVQLEGNTQSVLISVREIPKQWGKGDGAGQPVEVDGLFLVSESWNDSLDRQQDNAEADSNVEATTSESTQLERLHFVASRLQWFPQSVEGLTDVTPGQLWLSHHGMDTSLFADLKGRDARPLGTEDSETFYQLLATMSRLDALSSDEWQGEGDERLPVNKLELIQLMKSPGTSRGDAFLIEGNVRRVTKIEVDRAYFAERLDLDHYYQLDVFVKLEQNQVIRIAGKDGAEGPVFRNRFPVTICVAKLPPGLEPTEEVNKPIRVTAHFMRTWSYPTEYAQQFEDSSRQIGPMFVGHHLSVEQQPASTAFLTMLAAGFLAVSLGGTWVAMMLLTRRSKKTDEAIQKQHEGDPSFLAELEERERDTDATNTSI